MRRFEIEKRVCVQQARGEGADPALPLGHPLTGDENEWLERPEVKRALEIVRESARRAPSAIRPSHNLELDLGLDSMQRVELLSDLEGELGSDVEESRLAEIYSVRDLLESVLEGAGIETAPA